MCLADRSNFTIAIPNAEDVKLNIRKILCRDDDGEHLTNCKKITVMQNIHNAPNFTLNMMDQNEKMNTFVIMAENYMRFNEFEELILDIEDISVAISVSVNCFSNDKMAVGLRFLNDWNFIFESDGNGGDIVLKESF
jgi:hypothetical protein